MATWIFMAFLLESSWLPAQIGQVRSPGTTNRPGKNELEQNKSKKQKKGTFLSFWFLQILLTGHLGFLSITTTHTFRDRSQFDDDKKKIVDYETLKIDSSFSNRSGGGRRSTAANPNGKIGIIYIEEQIYYFSPSSFELNVKVTTHFSVN